MPGGGQSSSSSETGPWKGARPYLKDLYSRGDALSQTPLEYFPGQLQAPRSGLTQEALDQTQQLGIRGSANLAAAEDQNLRTQRGQFLDPNTNPFLMSTFNTAADAVTRRFNQAVLPNLESRFAGAGRTGSPAYQRGLGEAGRGLAGELGGLANQIFGQNYQQERGRQVQATQFTPQLDQSRFQGLQNAFGAGQQGENYAQSLIQMLMGKHDFLRDEGAQRLSQFAQLLGTQAPTAGSSSASAWNFKF